MLRNLLALLLLCGVLMGQPAEAIRYGSWQYYTDTRAGSPVECRVRASATAYLPGYGVTFRATSGSGSTAKAYVPHTAYTGLYLEALTPGGLGTSYMTWVCDLRRWDTGGNFWRYFDDMIISNWFPPNEGPLYYSTTRRHPYWEPVGFYDWVYVSPLGEYHACDAITTIALNEFGYLTAGASERTIYYVRP